jgi:hypothetical protein
MLVFCISRLTEKRAQGGAGRRGSPRRQQLGNGDGRSGRGTRPPAWLGPQEVGPVVSRQTLLGWRQ